jgi:hypothetical protein
VVPEVAGSIPVVHPPESSLEIAEIGTAETRAITRLRDRERKERKGVDTLLDLVTFLVFAASGCWTAAAAFCSTRPDRSPVNGVDKPVFASNRTLIEN